MEIGWSRGEGGVEEGGWEREEEGETEKEG